MRFEFATAGRIIFGAGTLGKIGDLAADKGRRAFLVTGKNVGRAAPLLEQLKKQDIITTQFSVPGEPTTELVLSAVESARHADCEFVIALGGGSVLDAGKVVAALLTNGGELMDYLEVIGRGQALKRKPAVFIAIPTTAGTGAEVTRNAVLDSPQHRVKVSMRSPLMLPDLALVDPELTYSIPPDITAVTGLDAFTQLLEAYVTAQANPLTDGICREGLQRAARSLKKACLDGQDISARRDMCLASLFGGLALANAKLGAVHGFAGPLGGMYDAPHGALCAGLLAPVLEINLQALRSRAPKSPAINRYDDVAQIVTADPAARASDGINWIRELCSQLRVPCLAEHGIKEADFADIVEKSKSASSMQGNPIELTEAELLTVLEKAI
ncbi:MAG: iron-containing alcohol dehydrogenase [Deltaproteobacteria bacterium]|jgi:alcohol dehydrogenase class IV|nr:iron-containing alcohol dehydrogenase [Deltaproteobacteria bacterium]